MRGLLSGWAPPASSSAISARIHLMAGRVPQGADRAAVRSEMEAVFLENLRHAAGVLAQVRPGTDRQAYRHECLRGRGGATVGRASEARGRALPSSEGTVGGFTSDWLRGDKTGAGLCSRVHHGARRASWDCWSPSIPASLTPSTSWTPPSRVGPQPCAPRVPSDSPALLGSHGPLPDFSPRGGHLTEGWKTQPPVTNGKWKKGNASQKARVPHIWGEWGGGKGACRVSD